MNFLFDGIFFREFEVVSESLDVVGKENHGVLLRAPFEFKISKFQ